jgi:hypothetical protein
MKCMEPDNIREWADKLERGESYLTEDWVEWFARLANPGTYPAFPRNLPDAVFERGTVLRNMRATADRIERGELVL